jgi:hypothetical protein
MNRGYKEHIFMHFTREKVWTTCGPEFSKVKIDGVIWDMSGYKVIIVKALYGLKSSGLVGHRHLADILRGLGFTPSRFDPVVWYRLSVEHDLYEYMSVLVHTQMTCW